MQVRAGGQAGGADVADHGALADLLALLQLAEARHVRVQGGVAAAVVQDHHVAVAALGADELHPGVAGGHDRGAGAGGVVHALVHAHAAQHRMPARAELRRQPCVRDRHADEALLQRPAVGGEVLGLAVAVEAEAGMGLLAGGEGRCQDPAGADPLALAPGFLDHGAEAVARLHVLEVDVVLEDLVGHHRDGGGAEPGLAPGRVQRAVDLGAGHRQPGGGGALEHLLVDLVPVQGQLHPLGRAAVEAEATQLPVRVQPEAQLGAWAQAGERIAVGGGVQDPVQGRRRHPHVLEYLAQGLPGLDLDDFPVRTGVAVGGFHGQRRQLQGQGGIGLRGRLQLRREARHDGGQQHAQGQEQAGMQPVLAGPAGVEGGGEALLQLAVQGAVVKDAQAVVELLLADAAVVGQGHRGIPSPGPGMRPSAAYLNHLKLVRQTIEAIAVFTGIPVNRHVTFRSSLSKPELRGPSCFPSSPSQIPLP